MFKERECISHFDSFPCFFSRSWDLERPIKQLKTYRDLYQALCKWICDAKRRQDSIESMKLCDSNTIMRYLHDQKVCDTWLSCLQLTGLYIALLFRNYHYQCSLQHSGLFWIITYKLPKNTTCVEVRKEKILLYFLFSVSTATDYEQDCARLLHNDWHFYTAALN